MTRQEMVSALEGKGLAIDVNNEGINDQVIEGLCKAQGIIRDKKAQIVEHTTQANKTSIYLKCPPPKGTRNLGFHKLCAQGEKPTEDQILELAQYYQDITDDITSLLG